jgi:hypothetical protein
MKHFDGMNIPGSVRIVLGIMLVLTLLQRNHCTLLHFSFGTDNFP